MKKEKLLDVDCPVYDIHVSMFLPSSLIFDPTAISCRRRRNDDDNNNSAMGGRGRGRGRGGVRGDVAGGGSPSPPPGPPPRPRTLEERMDVMERRLTNLTFAWRCMSEENTRIRQDALRCLGEIRLMNAQLLEELRRVSAPRPSQPP